MQEQQLHEFVLQLRKRQKRILKAELWQTYTDAINL